MKTLEWLKAAERPGGGIAAWQDEGGGYQRAYPEVTGYLIPTLLRYGETDLAMRCAEWLLTIQRPSGAWPGLYGKERTFDTAAVMEGLQAANEYEHRREFEDAIGRAEYWLLQQIRPDNTLKRLPEEDDTHIYTMRATWIMGHLDGVEAWLPASNWDIRKWGERQRPHYIAYGLEGLWHMGARKEVTDVLMAARKKFRGLFPLWARTDWVPDQGTDICATAQFAYLYGLAGMNAREELDAVERLIAADGGVYHGHEDRRKTSWAAKFYLDAKR